MISSECKESRWLVYKFPALQYFQAQIIISEIINVLWKWKRQSYCTKVFSGLAHCDPVNYCSVNYNLKFFFLAINANTIAKFFGILSYCGNPEWSKDLKIACQKNKNGKETFKF